MEIGTMNIGSKIRNARNEAGYTQEHAAEALKVSRQTISNWENEKSYPDIVSVIRMSDLYNVSLDHLLKEEKEVKDTYVEYLGKSTDTVASNNRMTKAILIAACLLVYAIAQMVFWLSTGAGLAAGNVVFKYVLLPITAILLSAFAGRNDWWGKGKWSLVAIFAILFLFVPQVSYEATATEATKNFMFPNFRYMIIGIVSSLVGLVAGMKFKKK